MGFKSKKEEFIEIYEREADAIYRYALLRVSDREEVVDIVQDTFTRLWQKMNGGSVIDYPRSFVFTIARNRIIDWYRKKKPHSLEIMMGSEDNVAFDVADENIHKNIESYAEARIALEALNKLSPSYREVIYLRFIENLPPLEISQILGMTPNAVSVRINRGLQELRNILRIDNGKE